MDRATAVVWLTNGWPERVISATPLGLDVLRTSSNTTLFSNTVSGFGPSIRTHAPTLLRDGRVARAHIFHRASSGAAGPAGDNTKFRPPSDHEIVSFKKHIFIKNNAVCVHCLHILYLQPAASTCTYVHTSPFNFVARMAHLKLFCRT